LDFAWVHVLQNLSRQKNLNIEYQAFRMRGPIEDDGDGSSVGPLVRRGLDAHG